MCVWKSVRESILYINILYTAYRVVQRGNLIQFEKLLKNLKKEDTPVSHVASRVASFRLQK